MSAWVCMDQMPSTWHEDAKHRTSWQLLHTSCMRLAAASNRQEMWTNLASCRNTAEAVVHSNKVQFEGNQKSLGLGLSSWNPSISIRRSKPHSSLFYQKNKYSLTILAWIPQIRSFASAFPFVLTSFKSSWHVLKPSERKDSQLGKKKMSS